MIGAPCPAGADHEPLRHPDAMLCYSCTARLPQRLRRAIRRANEGRESPRGVLQRCVAWIERRDAGITVEPPRPKAHLRYSTGGGS